MKSAHRFFRMNVYVKSFQLTLICEIHPCAPVSNERIVLESGNVVTFCSLVGNSMYLIDVYDSADLKWSLILCILVNFLYRIHWWYQKSGSVIALLWWLPFGSFGYWIPLLPLHFFFFWDKSKYGGESPLLRSEKSSEEASPPPNFSLFPHLARILKLNRNSKIRATSQNPLIRLVPKVWHACSRELAHVPDQVQIHK